MPTCYIKEKMDVVHFVAGKPLHSLALTVSIIDYNRSIFISHKLGKYTEVENNYIINWLDPFNLDR